MPAKIKHATGASNTYRSGMRFGASLAVLMAAAVSTTAFAQDPAPPAEEDVETVVVTGFRGSLQTSINAKKKENAIVDVIKADDIADFPDNNLAESLQRVPGIAIDRDGGEGRSIVVRGLGPDFTRVRVNGLEAQATAGGKDASGGANRGRGFDFNVFASELFNSLTVRKSMTADVEEGSLGATVDLQTARPFDYKGFTMAVGGQIGYNDLSEDTAPRGTFLISNRWADGKLGALLSVAYSERTVQEEGPNTTRWANAFSPSTSGRFAGYQLGTATTVTAIPATGTITNPTALEISNALYPRIPRYNRFSIDQKRLGVTGAFQMRPNPDTLITVDGMYAKFGADRQEYEIEAISFSRTGQGLPRTVVRDYTIDDEGTLIAGTFDNVDVRAEQRYDELSTTFKQLNLTWEQTINERLKATFLIGKSQSLTDNPEQTTFTFESYDVDGYSYDYTDSRNPVFNYGTSTTNCNTNQACYWTYSGSNTLGDQSLIRLRPQKIENEFATARVDLKWEINDILALKFGASKKTFDFFSTEFGRVTTNANSRDENASATTSAGLIAAINADLGKFSQSASQAGVNFLIPNLDLIRSTFNFNCNCVNSYGNFTVNNTNSNSRANTREAHEDDTAYYVQLDFDTEFGNIPVRGNVGVREVETELKAIGLSGVGTTARTTEVQRSYKDTLPSANIAVEPLENVIIRFAAAKTMSRPTLQFLSPGGSINTSGSTAGTIGSAGTPFGNPFLDPIRANTYDASFEWYPDADSLFSIGLFKKEIKSYIQIVAQYQTIESLGLEPALTAGLAAPYNDPNFNWLVYAARNTDGGDLEGFEISLQRRFTFLPGFLSNFGGIVNYTQVKSEIEYITNTTGSGGNVTNTYTTADLVNLSPTSWNTTLYYEDDKFSGRVAVAYRDGYISQLVPGNGSDYRGKNETTNVDAQFSYKVNKHLTLVAEAINITDEYDDGYIAYNTPQGNTGQDLLYDYSHSGRSYYLGFRYKY
ncbi:TonB-dependent receptor [Asticcacaulis sp. SL142]|uniref:TonB-dependent receptor n=1 Tax=Asticcacaulis sp. SL142 TaxID=2995155 RepID=UPI00226D335D|nr:TonB-dependent receptor [Asticcacaulis sp. SL142]WAC47526.1 TonB-dependent receptor [Asticcacaulis sp. SL142]